MRDMLIELLMNMPYGHKTYEQFADHLLANGVLVPPCKVGDNVWCIEENYNGDFCISKRFVSAILITDTGMRIRCGFCLYKPQEVGKELFFNEAEAEKALAERKK